MTFPPRSVATTLTLSALVALGPLSTDMYLPALPRIANEFNESVANVQLTLSLFLFGFAIAQLFYGVLSDRFGRKPVLLSGMAIFIVASIGCSLTENIYALMFFRLLQALGGSAGPVLGRAIVRDFYKPADAGKVLSQIAMVMGVAPAVAPIIGGFFTVYLGWQSIFWFLALYGLIGAWVFKDKVVESAPAEFRQSQSMSIILKNYKQLLSDRVYMGFTLACGFSAAGLLSFISGSSFVLIDLFGVSEQRFGLFFMLMVAGYIIGSYIGSRLSHTKGHHFLVGLGCVFCYFSGALMLILCSLESVGIASVIVPMMLFAAGVGLVMPQSMAGALAHYPHIAGTASGLLGFLQMMLSGIAGAIVGHAYNDSAVPMAFMIALMGLFSMLSFLLLVAIRTRAGK